MIRPRFGGVLFWIIGQALPTNQMLPSFPIRHGSSFGTHRSQPHGLVVIRWWLTHEQERSLTVVR